MTGEDLIQSNFFCYVHTKALTDDRYKLIYAVPNGGYRSKTTAITMKRTGVKPGVYDVAVDVPNSKYHGLKIEFKYGKNKLTDKQVEYAELVERQGYKCTVCYSVDEAIKKLEIYLNE